MTEALVEETVKDFKARLMQKYGDNLVSLILFGSAARGEGDEESDTDVLVVLQDYEDFWREFHAVADIAYQVSMNTDFQVLLSPMLFRESEYEDAADILLLNIKKEGVTV